MPELEAFEPSSLRLLALTIVCLLLVAGLALAASAAALPKQITVCGSGCDFTSVNAAANDAKTNAGDGIQVSPGTYTEQVSVPKQLNIFGAAGGARPVITSAAANASTFEIAAGGTGTIVSHLDIRGTGTNTTALRAVDGAVNASDLALSATGRRAQLAAVVPSQLGPGVSADGFIDAGINAADSVTGVTVADNSPGASGLEMFMGTLTDSMVDADYALSTTNEVTVRRTTLNGGHQGVLAQFLGGAPGLISDSVITSSASGGSAVFALGGPGPATDTLKLRNVTAYASGSGSNGLLATRSTSTSATAQPAELDARNAIVRGAGTDLMAEPAENPCPGGHTCKPGTVMIGYSNFVTTAGLVDSGTVGHNQSADPLLVNPVVGPGQDFHIACSGSPVIGTGIADAANGPSDRDGVPHPNPPSIGAYEFVGSAPCGGAGAVAGATTTGLRAAALKKCKKKHSARKRRKCRKRAKLLPV